jgi:hypothetical protein
MTQAQAELYLHLPVWMIIVFGLGASLAGCSAVVCR